MSSKPPVPSLDDSSLVWQSPEQCQSIDATHLQVLCDPTSLTARLKQLSGGGFAVDVLQEGWIRLKHPALLSAFGPVAPEHRFWSRHVILKGRGEPWVMAHSLLPEHAASSPLREVMDLQNKPLGEFLFQHPELLRMNLELVKTAGNNWGRRSLFSLYNKPIMVAEFFMQAFPFNVALTQMNVD
jgi:chorismate--pyruvate lyase